MDISFVSPSSGPGTSSLFNPGLKRGKHGGNPKPRRIRGIAYAILNEDQTVPCRRKPRVSIRKILECGAVGSITLRGLLLHACREDFSPRPPPSFL